jgi:aspartate aminotransferase
MLFPVRVRPECPQSGFYAMSRVPDGWVDEVIDHGVVVPGHPFGANGAGHARISYAADMATLKEALAIMGEATAAAVR